LNKSFKRFLFFYLIRIFSKKRKLPNRDLLSNPSKILSFNTHFLLKIQKTIKKFQTKKEQKNCRHQLYSKRKKKHSIIKGFDRNISNIIFFLRFFPSFFYQQQKSSIIVIAVATTQKKIECKYTCSKATEEFMEKTSNIYMINIKQGLKEAKKNFTSTFSPSFFLLNIECTCSLSFKFFNLSRNENNSAFV
jgi:hypothetical protein